DQLTVEHVALEQHLLLASLEGAQVELCLAQDHSVVLDLRYAVGTDVGGASRDLHEKPRDRWIADAAKAHDHVLHPPETLAVAVAQRPTHQRGEVQYRWSLQRSRAHATNPTCGLACPRHGSPMRLVGGMDRTAHLDIVCPARDRPAGSAASETGRDRLSVQRWIAHEQLGNRHRTQAALT